MSRTRVSSEVCNSWDCPSNSSGLSRIHKRVFLVHQIGHSGRLPRRILAPPGQKKKRDLPDCGTVGLSLFSHLTVGAPGFEPGTSWSRTRRASRAALRPDVLQERAEIYATDSGKSRYFTETRRPFHRGNSRAIISATSPSAVCSFIRIHRMRPSRRNQVI